MKTATAARRAIEENLERAGYAVRAAGNAAEARRLVETEEPALAFVDLILPDGDGISVLGELRGACSHRKCTMAAAKKEALGSLAKSLLSKLTRVGAVGWLFPGLWTGCGAEAR